MSSKPDVAGHVRDLFAAIDRKDTDSFVDFLTEDAVIRFGSGPSVEGRAGIREMIGGFFASIQAVAHDLAFAELVDDRLVCEGTVTYTRHDDSQVTLPFVNVLDLAGDDARPPIRHYKVYIDIAPLYAGGD